MDVYTEPQHRVLLQNDGTIHFVSSLVAMQQVN